MKGAHAPFFVISSGLAFRESKVCLIFHKVTPDRKYLSLRTADQFLRFILSWIALVESVQFPL